MSKLLVVLSLLCGTLAQAGTLFNGSAYLGNVLTNGCAFDPSELNVDLSGMVITDLANGFKITGTINIGSSGTTFAGTCGVRLITYRLFNASEDDDFTTKVSLTGQVESSGDLSLAQASVLSYDFFGVKTGDCNSRVDVNEPSLGAGIGGVINSGVNTSPGCTLPSGLHALAQDFVLTVRSAGQTGPGNLTIVLGNSAVSEGITFTTAVPEPGTALTMAIGGLLLATLRMAKRL